MKYLKLSIIALIVTIPFIFWYKCKSNNIPSEDGGAYTVSDKSTETQKDNTVNQDKFSYLTLVKCTTIQLLTEIYGANSLVDMGMVEEEGQAIEGSHWLVLFKNTKNECVIKQFPKGSIYEFHQLNSEWELPSNMRVGMNLSKLEDINGAPISFYGFEWDYPGLIYEWNNGVLSRVEGLKVRGALGTPVGDLTGVTGDIELNSRMELVKNKYSDLRLESISLQTNPRE